MEQVERAQYLERVAALERYSSRPTESWRGRPKSTSVERGVQDAGLHRLAGRGRFDQLVAEAEAFRIRATLAV
jgi:hypothetical protein